MAPEKNKPVSADGILIHSKVFSGGGTTDAPSPMGLSNIYTQFSKLKSYIDVNSAMKDADKGELKSIIEMIEHEIKQGDSVDLARVERWLRFLAEVSIDVFENITDIILTSTNA